jgi:hypothetical protein
MLLFLIPIVWLALLSLLAALCRVAADGDAAGSAHRQQRSISIGTKLVLSAAPIMPSSQRRRLNHRREFGSRRVAHRQRTVHGLR